MTDKERLLKAKEALENILRHGCRGDKDQAFVALTELNKVIDKSEEHTCIYDVTFDGHRA